MIEQLGVPPEQLVLAAEQTLYMVFVSLVVGVPSWPSSWP